jgi:HAD superfamily hydrolase (TIGR01484 family)
MPVKMIVTDLDGTLLRRDKKISDFSASILNRCVERGIRLVFATARPKRAINHFLKNIPVNTFILHNGAVIYMTTAYFTAVA